jgi:hypothetical protein
VGCSLQERWNQLATDLDTLLPADFADRCMGGSVVFRGETIPDTEGLPGKTSQ